MTDAATDCTTGNRIVNALKNGPGTISTRSFILVLLPALCAFSVWSGERLVAKLDDLDRKVDDNHVEVLRLNGTLDARVTGVEHDVNFLQRMVGK